MSAFALFCIIVGLLMIATRAPLIVAPEKTRDIYMHALLDTKEHVRSLGIFMGLFGAFALLVAGGVPGAVATIIQIFGLVMIIVSVGFLAPYPARAMTLARKVWYSFAPRTLRILGLLAVVLGGALVWYGFVV